MVRSSAKNHASVAVVTSPGQYPQLLEALAAGGFTLAERQQLAAEAFAHTAAYDVAVAGWLRQEVTETADALPELGRGHLAAGRGAALRREPAPAGRALSRRGRLARAPDWRRRGSCTGNRCRYNNYVDADAARRSAYDFAAPAVAIIKHANPCGIAVGADIAEAHRKAHACDPVSAFGGVIAANRPVSAAMAEQVAEVFTEVVLAPGYEAGARRGAGRRRRTSGCSRSSRTPGAGRELRQIDGGVLVQTRDRTDAAHDRAANWQLVAGEPVSAELLADLEFAWAAVRAVKSNAILLARDGASVGVGMGQVNRVDSCRLAVQRGGDRVRGIGGGLGRVLPVRRRPADPAGRRGVGDRPARGVGARRRGDRGRPGQRGRDVPDRRPALLPLRAR